MQKFAMFLLFFLIFLVLGVAGAAPTVLVAEAKAVKFPKDGDSLPVFMLREFYPKKHKTMGDVLVRLSLDSNQKKLRESKVRTIVPFDFNLLGLAVPKGVAKSIAAHEKALEEIRLEYEELTKDRVPTPNPRLIRDNIPYSSKKDGEMFVSGFKSGTSTQKKGEAHPTYVETKLEEADCIWIEYRLNNSKKPTKLKRIALFYRYERAGESRWQESYMGWMQAFRESGIGGHRAWLLIQSLNPKTEFERVCTAFLAHTAYGGMNTQWWTNYGYGFPRRDEIRYNLWALTPFLKEGVDKKMVAAFISAESIYKMSSGDIEEVDGVLMTSAIKEARTKLIKDLATRQGGRYVGPLKPETLPKLSVAAYKKRYTKYYNKHLAKAAKD